MTLTVEQVMGKLKFTCPEIEETKITAATSFKKIPLDSMDIASFMLELEESFGVKVPNADIGKLDSINQVIAYISEKTV